MRKLGGSSMIVMAAFLIVVGIIIQSDIAQRLLNIFGWLVVVVGIIVLVMGIFQWLAGGRGNRKNSSYDGDF